MSTSSPITSLNVSQGGSDAPVLSWTHPGGSIEGFDVYLGDETSDVKFNGSPLTAMTFSDQGWSGDQRTYTVRAVDGVDEGPARSITLPVIEAVPVDGQVLRRGVMNRLEYTVHNPGATGVSSLRLKLAVSGRTHQSETFTLAAGETRTVTVIVGGYSDLEGYATLQRTLEIRPGADELISIVRQDMVAVEDGMLVLSVLPEEFTRGGSGQVRFTLENTGAADIEILTARYKGSKASDEVLFYLEDEEGNVLTSVPFYLATGNEVTTLASGQTVVTIASGASFTSPPMTLSVPSVTPDNAVMRMRILKVRHHTGAEDEVTLSGFSSSAPVSLAETAYYGQITSITPEVSDGSEPVVISGRAVERANSEPLGKVPLRLVLSCRGFERVQEVYTDADGLFSHDFTSQGDGRYSVSVLHPDMTERPVHGEFSITRVSVTPSERIGVTIPRNYTQKINIRVKTGYDTQLHNLRLEYPAAEQQGGDYATGIHLTVGDAISSVGTSRSVSRSPSPCGVTTRPRKPAATFSLSPATRRRPRAGRASASTPLSSKAMTFSA